MATITKTQGISLIPLQSVASNSVVVGSPVDVSTKLAATVFMRVGRMFEVALTEGIEIRVEASAVSSGDDYWWNLYSFKSSTAQPEEENVVGTANAGSVTVSVSQTNMTYNDIVFFKNATFANSEWGRLKSWSANSSMTFEDAIINAQTGSVMYNKGEFCSVGLDLRAVGRIRVVADGRNTGLAVAVEALMVTGDSIG